MYFYSSYTLAMHNRPSAILLFPPGLVVYFKYGIKNSALEMKADEEAVSPPTPSPLDRTTLPPPSAQPARHVGDRNIFEGDGSSGLYGNLE